MRLHEQLGFEEPLAIDWEITPADTFGIFESWGGKIRVRSDRERYYYFYVDAWCEPPRLLLMERGVKHARVLARINAPQELISGCIAGQGKGMLDKSYAIDAPLKQWITEHVLEVANPSLIEVMVEEEEAEETATDLPRPDEVTGYRRLPVRHEPAMVAEEDLPAIARKFDFFDSRLNPGGSFRPALADNQDGLTVIELASGVMWQRGGCDITNIRNIQRYVEEANAKGFAGFHDWRLPTVEEAMALLLPEANRHAIHLHPCFSRHQPFIFLADQRQPGGYWFMDFKQATVFWASGTIPGGFGRLCRTAQEE